MIKSSIRNLLSRVLYVIPSIHFRNVKRLGILHIGAFSYGFPKLKYWDLNTKVYVGKYCSIAEEVTFVLGGNHHKEWTSTFPFSEFISTQRQEDINFGKEHPASKGDIEIGHDVWIGQKVTILSGVKVGNGAIIGACSTVAKSVPDYSIVVGNPAKIVGYRFSQKEIQELLSIAWWDWPEEVIWAHASVLMSNLDIPLLRKIGGSSKLRTT